MTLSVQKPSNPGVLPNQVLGMLIFIGTEVMFFSALISAYLVIHSQRFEWPPAGQPRLPVEATAFNTVVLLLSWVVLFLAGRQAAKKADHRKVRLLIGLSILLGAFFVVFQGYEWVRLVGFGLTMASSVYGALFYLIIGSHAVHVTAALGFLVSVWFRIGRDNGKGMDPAVFDAARILWTFVVGVWPLLYYLVYIS